MASTRAGARAPGEAVLELDGVVPGAAPLTLHRGEIVGIAGLLGAGRTRLLRAIFGLEPVKAGRIAVGAYSGAAGPHDRWRQGMGMLSEDRAGEGLAARIERRRQHDADAAVAVRARVHRLARRGRIAAAARLDRSPRRSAARTRARRSRELSGGNQQKVAVARLLHHDVDVLVLDEPTRGIDVASKAQIYELIDELVSGSDAKARAARQQLPAGAARASAIGLR